MKGRRSRQDSDLIGRLKQERNKALRERDEARPFMEAVKKRHNGYSDWWEGEPPATPEIAMKELLAEKDAMFDGIVEELARCKKERDEARREAEELRASCMFTSDGKPLVKGMTVWPEIEAPDEKGAIVEGYCMVRIRDNNAEKSDGTIELDKDDAACLRSTKEDSPND